MSTFIVLSMTPKEPVCLVPAPNVTESEDISRILNRHQVSEITNLMAGPITILTQYRGWVVYCEGGVTMYRNSPLLPGGNGYAGYPIPWTIEEVTIHYSAGWFDCSILFYG